MRASNPVSFGSRSTSIRRPPRGRRSPRCTGRRGRRVLAWLAGCAALLLPCGAAAGGPPTGDRFESRLALRVMELLPSGGAREVGRTPTADGAGVLAPKGPWFVAPAAPPADPGTWLAALAQEAREKSIPGISAAGLAISDAWLASLEGLPTLTYLDLSSTPVTDAGLGHLARYPALHHLALGMGRISSGQIAVTGAGLARVAAVKALVSLSLPYFPAADADLAPLAGLAGADEPRSVRTPWRDGRGTDRSVRAGAVAQALARHHRRHGHGPRGASCAPDARGARPLGQRADGRRRGDARQGARAGLATPRGRGGGHRRGPHEPQGPSRPADARSQRDGDGRRDGRRAGERSDAGAPRPVEHAGRRRGRARPRGASRTARTRARTHGRDRRGSRGRRRCRPAREARSRGLRGRDGPRSHGDHRSAPLGSAEPLRLSRDGRGRGFARDALHAPRSRPDEDRHHRSWTLGARVPSELDLPSPVPDPGRGRRHGGGRDPRLAGGARASGTRR